MSINVTLTLPLLINLACRRVGLTVDGALMLDTNQVSSQKS